MKILRFIPLVAVAATALFFTNTASAHWHGCGWGGWRGGWCGPVVNVGIGYYPAWYPYYGYYEPVYYVPPVRRVYVGREVVPAADSVAVDVQRALARRGYYRGPIDGDVGPQTRAAIREYQEEHNLPVTGRIDSRLLRSLGV